MTQTSMTHLLPRARVLLLAVALAASLCLSFEDEARAAAFVVDSVTDAIDAVPGDGVCADSRGFCTLRAATMEANALPGPDDVSLPEGTYLLEIPGRLEDAAASGDLDITDELIIRGAGRNKSIIDAGGLDRVFETIGSNLSSFSASIEGLTIRNGNAEFSEQGGGFLGGSGAGIFNGNRISLTLADVAIVNNTATIFGGGIRSNSFTSSLTISNSVVSHNYADQGGAAISNLGIATVTETAIIGNSARLGPGAIDNSNGVSLKLVNTTVERNQGNIGAISNGDSELSVTKSSITQNISTVGGGIFGGGIIRLEEVTVSNNIAAFGEGGGINYSGGAEGETVLELTNSTVSGNASAFEGGGIHTWTPGKIVITNSTISGNKSGDPKTEFEDQKRGGGIFVLFGELELTNVTVDGNSAPVGGGVSNNEANAAVGPVTLKNTIVSNSAGGDCAGPITSGGHNLSSDSSCGFAAPGDLENADPKLGPLADNGGPTRAHALLAGSPAIDAGDAGTCPAADQRGVARPVDGNSDGSAVCDMGAFEAAAGTTAPVPSPGPTTSPGPPASPHPTPGSLPGTGGRPGASGRATLPGALGAAAAAAVAATAWLRRRLRS